MIGLLVLTHDVLPDASPDREANDGLDVLQPLTRTKGGFPGRG
jgi:hypothetical protein